MIFCEHTTCFLSNVGKCTILKSILKKRLSVPLHANDKLSATPTRSAKSVELFYPFSPDIHVLVYQYGFYNNTFFSTPRII